LPGELMARLAETSRHKLAQSRDLLAVSQELRRKSITLLWPEGTVRPCLLSMPRQRRDRQVCPATDIDGKAAEVRIQVKETWLRIAESRFLIADGNARQSRRSQRRQQLAEIRQRGRA
jgi:hypothetical protein